MGQARPQMHDLQQELAAKSRKHSQLLILSGISAQLQKYRQWVNSCNLAQVLLRADEATRWQQLWELPFHGLNSSAVSLC